MEITQYIIYHLDWIDPTWHARGFNPEQWNVFRNPHTFMIYTCLRNFENTEVLSDHSTSCFLCARNIVLLRIFRFIGIFPVMFFCTYVLISDSLAMTQFWNVLYTINKPWHARGFLKARWLIKKSLARVPHLITYLIREARSIFKRTSYAKTPERCPSKQGCTSALFSTVAMTCSVHTLQMLDLSLTSVASSLQYRMWNHDWGK